LPKLQADRNVVHRMVSMHDEVKQRPEVHPLRWLGTRDRGLLALRRAGRAAIVMPAMFAFGDKVLDNPQLATFAAFGAFAMLMLVDFGGPRGDRVRAMGSLAVAGAVLVCIGTLASREPWLAAAAMCVVGFAVLFAGVVSSVTAGATTALLLSFILPVSLPGPPSAIPDRVAGWALAGVVAVVAVALLWPAPAEDRLRGSAVATCRALAARLRAEAAYVLASPGGGEAAEYDQAVAAADTAVSGLHRLFLATPYRPTGLSTAARATVRLVDELNWLNAVLLESRPTAGAAVDRVACTVRCAAATALESGAALLETPRMDPGPLRAALGRLRLALDELESGAMGVFPLRAVPAEEGTTLVQERVEELVDSLDPGFRAQELCFVVSAIGRNIDLAAGADRRGWFDRLLGRHPESDGTGTEAKNEAEDQTRDADEVEDWGTEEHHGDGHPETSPVTTTRFGRLPGTFSAAQERAAAHVERHSLWLHNSVRGGIGLGLAVLVADLTDVQHSFWVVLGTLSVLRSNALNTGQNAVRAVVGTSVGFAIGAVLLLPVGGDTTLLWCLLPLAILLAGTAPTVISFAAGQAAFTLVLVILFNIIQPTGWRVGLVRVEDIALGCVISIVVGILLWPRGAAAALSKALAEAYADSAHYLAAAVEFGVHRCESGLPDVAVPTREAVRAAAAARRMDDTFRGYLAERGAKPLPLAEVTRLVTGVAGLRLAADAVLDLWERDEVRADGDRAAARAELLRNSELIKAWYDDLAESLDGHRPVPEPLDRDRAADERLLSAVRHDLSGQDGQAGGTAVRMIWTGDHLDAARRLQASLVQPAVAAGGRGRSSGRQVAAAAVASG
jgi:uncharacterized membrane protein YccC